MKYLLVTVAAIAFLGGITTSAEAANRRVEGALQNSGDLSMFYEALLRSGVANELNENSSYTVFAPTNSAFVQELPRASVCYNYSAPCRGQLAMVMRNHIVPSSESVSYLAKLGGDIPTLGTRRLYVEEAYKDSYTVEGQRVLNKSDSTYARVYRIDGIIANEQELTLLQAPQIAEVPATVTQKTVTTYSQPYATTTTVVPYPGPAGQLTSRTVTVTHPDPIMDPADLPEDTTQTTTVTRTITSQSTP